MWLCLWLRLRLVVERNSEIYIRQCHLHKNRSTAEGSIQQHGQVSRREEPGHESGRYAATGARVRVRKVRSNRSRGTSQESTQQQESGYEPGVHCGMNWVPGTWLGSLARSFGVGCSVGGLVGSLCAVSIAALTRSNLQHQCSRFIHSHNQQQAD